MGEPSSSYGAIAPRADGGESGQQQENHARTGEFLSDCVLGMSDGLTVPYVGSILVAPAAPLWALLPTVVCRCSSVVWLLVRVARY